MVARIVLLLLAVSLVAGRCGGGSGGGGSRPVVKIRSSDVRCLPLSGAFPPALDELPGVGGLAAVALFEPPAVLTVDLEPVPPRVASPGPVPAIPADSDGDGLDDRAALRDAGRPAARLGLAGLAAVRDDLVVVAANGYEEVLLVEPVTGTLRQALVATPASFAPDDAPFLPPPGSEALRTAISTLQCVRVPAGSLDSEGSPVPPSCDPAEPSFETNFTSGVAFAGGHLFVSTSNFARVGREPRLWPGSVLVYRLDLGASPPRAEPRAASPALTTESFNPTGVVSYTTPAGHPVVLVNGSGAVRVATGAEVALSDSSIDVIDALDPRVVASIPLGKAALSSARLAVHPSGRLAVGGSFAFRELFAVDLARVDAALATHAAGTPPIRLDGSDPRLPFDARIFHAASPLGFPGLPDGAPPDRCAGAVFGVAFSADGSKLFASDFCDGLLALFSVDLSGLPANVPVPPERFALLETRVVTRPNDPARFPDAASAPGPLLVRRGLPGIDYRGPDVFVLVGLPEGELCGLRIDSF